MNERDERLVEAFLDDLGSAPVPPGLVADVGRRIRDERPARAGRFGAYWAVAAALVGIVALGGLVFAVAGPKPSPSVSAVLPSTSASPSPSSTPTAVGTSAPTSGAIPGPVNSAQPSAAPTFHVTLDPGGSQMPALVIDNSATVRAAIAASPELASGDPVEVTQGSAPDTVIVSWLGSSCDGVAQLVIDPGRTAATVSTWWSPQGCDGSRIDRAVELTFDGPVTASSLRGRPGSPLTTLGYGAPSAVAFADVKHGFVAGADQLMFPGLAYLSETTDGGKTWTTSPVGWGAVTGLATASTEVIAAQPLVAISCAARGGAPDPACVPGVYAGPGPRLTRLAEVDPAAIAARQAAIAVLVNDPLLPTVNYAFPPRHLELSTDDGTSWRSVPSPCPDLEATGVALDGQGRPLVVCQSEPGGGMAQKVMYRATDPQASAWTKLPAPPEMGTLFTMSIASDGTGLMWGPRSPLLATTDGGAGWGTIPWVADGNVRIVQGGSALVGDRGVVLVWDPDHPMGGAYVLELVTYHGLDSQTEMAAFPQVSGGG